MLPACCLPLWGRERGTLQAAAENKRITHKKEDFNKAPFSLIKQGCGTKPKKRHMLQDFRIKNVQ